MLENARFPSAADKEVCRLTSRTESLIQGTQTPLKAFPSFRCHTLLAGNQFQLPKRDFSFFVSYLQSQVSSAMWLGSMPTNDI